MVLIPAQVNYVENISYDQLGKEHITNLNKGFGACSLQSYNYVNDVARALIGLTAMTYNDSNVVMTKSVEQALAEDE